VKVPFRRIVPLAPLRYGGTAHYKAGVEVKAWPLAPNGKLPDPMGVIFGETMNHYNRCGMRRLIRPLYELSCIGGTVFLVMLSIWAGSAGSASAQGIVKSKHGDWELRCETPPGAQHEQCALLQSVAAEDKPNINLVVIVLKTADGKSRLLRVIAPLGVLLPSGLGLKIDDADVGRAGFVRCITSGCVAEVVMEDKLIEQMKNGQTATFIIFQTPEEGTGIPLALAGFREGYDALQ
jgi:invasion protein IalB